MKASLRDAGPMRLLLRLLPSIEGCRACGALLRPATSKAAIYYSLVPVGSLLFGFLPNVLRAFGQYLRENYVTELATGRRTVT